MKKEHFNRLDIRQFPLRGSQLIEASAGTGKTYTIALLYTRAILQHGEDHASQRPLLPEEILVVTFTDAASQELKDRIRARLAEAAHCFLEPQAEHDITLTALRDDYPQAQWLNCGRLLTLAAQGMDQAAVSTIHSWCFRMLKEHAFDSGTLFQQTLINDQQEILAGLVRDYWRQHFYTLSASAAEQINKLLKNPDSLLDMVRPLINRSGTTITYAGQPLASLDDLQHTLDAHIRKQERIAELDQQARALWLQHRQELEAILDDKRDHLNQNSYREAKDDLAFQALKDELSAWAQGGPEPQKGLDRFAQNRWKLKQSSSQPRHTALQAIAHLLDTEVGVEDSQKKLHALLKVHCAHYLEDALRQRIQQTSELGPDDLLLQLDRALQGPRGNELAEQIRSQYPLAMIDEFQDTDPLQYRIFNRIYQIDSNRQDCAVVMIGDPKQAIYSFRNADIHSYLEARRATQGRHHHLDTNYRSSEALINAVNRFFMQGENTPHGAFHFKQPSGNNPLPFYPVNANGRSDILQVGGQQQTALTIWHLDADSGNEVVSQDSYNSVMTETCAQTISGLLNNEGIGFSLDGRLQPLRPRDIAILVRSAREASLIRTALQRYSLNSVYLSDRESIFTTSEARDMLLCLRACANPGDENSLRAILGSHTLARSIGELETLYHDELAWDDISELFRTLRKIWHQQGVLAMIRHLLHKLELPHHLRQMNDGDRRLTNLLHLAEYLQRASVSHEGEQGLIRHLKEQIRNPGSEEVLRLESDEDLIKVVTIHKSKGLEYPLVFVPFASTWRKVSGSNRQVMIMEQATGRRRLEIAGNQRDTLAWELADEERLSEDLRLLYVAMTRATHALWLSTAPLTKNRAKKCLLHESALGYLLGGGEALDKELLQTRLQALADNNIIVKTAQSSAPESTAPPKTLQPAEAPQYKPARRARHQAADNWWIASYSALQIRADRTDIHELVAARDEQTMEEMTTPLEDADSVLSASPRQQFSRFNQGLHGFHRGPEPGTFLHGLLEAAAQHGFREAAQDTGWLEDMISRRCRMRDWQTDEQRLQNWLGSFLNTPFAIPGNADLRLSTLPAYQCEMEFLFSSHEADTCALDALCRQYLLPGQDRPGLLSRQLNGMVKGFIDLVAEHQGKYYVIDWKSNYLGPDNRSYKQPALQEEILHKRYDVQYAMYLLALHRLLGSRVPDYDCDRHLGGALYFFLRGWQADSQGVMADKPPADFINALDALFSGTQALPLAGEL